MSTGTAEEVRAPAASDFSVVGWKLVLFTRPEGFSLARVATELGAELAKFGETKFLGDFVGVTPEIPRLLVDGEAHGWNIQVGPARCDITWKFSAAEPTPEMALSKMVAFASAYRDRVAATVVRVALLPARLARHSHPGLVLARHFCKPQWSVAPLNRPESFELHAHKTYNFAGLNINSWFRAKSGFLQAGDGSREPVIIVEQDLNTLAADAELPRETVTDFYAKAPAEADSILRLYFPPEP